MPDEKRSPKPGDEPPDDILQCLKEIWIGQAYTNHTLKEHDERFQSIDQRLEKHEKCLRPLQLSWCTCRLICQALGASWLAKLVAAGLVLAGADGILRTLQGLKLL